MARGAANSILLASGQPVRTLYRTPLVDLGEFRCHPEYHDFRRAGAITRHCVVFPRRAVWIQHEGERAFVADPTRITLYNPHQSYQRTALDPQGDSSDWISITSEVARQAVERRDPRSAEAPIGVFRWPYAQAGAPNYLAGRMLHAYIRGHASPDRLLVEESTIHLLASIVDSLYDRDRVRSRRSEATAPRHYDIVEDVCADLNESFAGTHSLESFAKRAGVSVFHLCRIFRKGTGLTIHAYRQQLRLRNALEPLERGHKDLLALALDLGYSGHSHFTSAFRRQFGMAPSELRARWQALAVAKQESDTGIRRFAAKVPGQEAHR